MQNDSKMTEKSFQEYYPDHFSHCYGCGSLNKYGLHVQSFWDGDESVCNFKPEPYHIAIPGYVYGGLIASIIDCHGTGTASAAAYRAAGRQLGTEPYFRFVTASLHVDYLQPTPIGIPLELRGKAIEIKGRKVIVEVRLFANEVLCAQGRVVAVQIPEHLLPSVD